MSIDDVIDAYLRLSEDVFSERKLFFQDDRYEATRLARTSCKIEDVAGQRNVGKLFGFLNLAEDFSKNDQA